MVISKDLDMAYFRVMSCYLPCNNEITVKPSQDSRNLSRDSNPIIPKYKFRM